MSRTKLYGQIFDVEIIDTTVDGKGVARLNDKVFFVANAVPGDKVQIKVISKKRRFFEAKLGFAEKFKLQLSNNFSNS